MRTGFRRISVSLRQCSIGKDQMRQVALPQGHYLRINLTILSGVSVSILPVITNITNRRYSYDTTATKNDRVSPTQGPLGTYSGELRPGRASIGGALSQIPRLDL